MFSDLSLQAQNLLFLLMKAEIFTTSEPGALSKTNINYNYKNWQY